VGPTARDSMGMASYVIRLAAENIPLYCSNPTEVRLGFEEKRRRVGAIRLVFVQIFAGHIVLRYLMGVNFLLVRVPSVFHASHHVGLERVPFLD